MKSEFLVGKLKLKCFSSLNEVSLSQLWDSILPTENELRSSHLLAIELCRPASLKFQYIFVEDSTNNRLLAIFYFQEIIVSSNNIQITDNFLLNLALQACLTIKEYKLLLSGNLFSIGIPSYYFSRENTPADMYTTIIDFVFKNCKPTVFVVKDLEDREKDSLMADSAYNKFDFDTTMVLKIADHWKTMNDYRLDLRKKYRTRFDKIRSSGKELQRIDLTLTSIINQSSRINELFNQVAQRQNVRLGIIDENYFIEHKRILGDQFKLIGYYSKDKLIAFSTYKNHGRELEVHYIGIDYAYNSTYQLYFNILYDALGTGIAEGYKEIELGRTSRDAKANMGSIPRSTTGFYRVDNHLSRSLLQLLQRHFQKTSKQNQDIRHPFKSVSS